MPENDDAFSHDGGHPSLDLVNTLDDRDSDHPDELLPNYAALAAFALSAGLIDLATRDSLERVAERRPFEAMAVVASVQSLREAIHSVALATIADRTPEPTALRTISRQAAQAMAAGRFVPAGVGFGWDWSGAEPALEQPLWRLAHAAIDLFSHQDLSRLRQCAAGDCGWLFLDETRNRSRKWCDMNTCGNRVKVARYREGRSREQGVESRNGFEMRRD